MLDCQSIAKRLTWGLVVLALLAQPVAAGVNLSGRLLHDGSGSGFYYVLAFRLDASHPLADFDMLLAPGSYEITDVPGNTSYALFAFKDLDGNLLPGIGEPVGWYGLQFPRLISVGANDVDGLDIQMRQPPFMGAICGHVDYRGSLPGRIWVVPHWDRVFAPSRIAGTPWTIEDPDAEYQVLVFGSAPYYVTAWIDENANLQLDAGEPHATTSQPVTISCAGQISYGNDIILSRNPTLVESFSWSAIKRLYDR